MPKIFKDIYWYLEQVGGMEVFYFDDHKKAYDFGHKVREQENGIDVEIGTDFVRIKLIEQEAGSRKKPRF
jgi:hypothetical protein